MGLGSLLVRGVPVGVQTVLPLPRQWSFVPAVISIPAASPLVILVIQALPGEWGRGILVIGWIGVPLCSCLARVEGDFRDWEDLCSYLVVGVFFSSYRKVWDWDRYV